jgi:hypothetical protein
MEVPNIITGIDWKLLRKQKRLLLQVINNDNVNFKEKEALEGILNLIDAIQDYAVDDAQIVTEIEVFGKLK